jgi:ribosomal protein L16/L10AE
MNSARTITLLVAEVRMTHLDRPYFVTMGTYQMAILLQFNEHQQLTLTELEEATKLNMKELEKQTNSLIEAKFLVGSTVSVLVHVHADTVLTHIGRGLPLI